jgi:hypothetical protein
MDRPVLGGYVTMPWYPPKRHLTEKGFRNFVKSRTWTYARELAGSGKFACWRALAFELQFEPGFFDAYKWLYSPSTREELERLCKEARKQREPSPSTVSDRCRTTWAKG